MGSFLSSQSRSQLPPACSSAATAARSYPQWMLVAPYGGGNGEACNITGDSKTIAAAATSNGHRISVSLRREPPLSAPSRICLRFLPGTDYGIWACSTVIAAHNGSLLLQITSKESTLAPNAFDYFVYVNVGAAAAADPSRPPSLYLLPPPRRRLDISATALLCRGEAEFVVAELKIVGSKDDDAAAAAARPIAFELRLFRHGTWCVKRPCIVHGGGRSGVDGNQQLWAQWETTAVVPLGNGMLCWVGRRQHSGVIFSDVLDEGPNNDELRYVPYPRQGFFLCTNVRGALKLVAMAPRRCSHCGCSEHATAFDIWTLNTDDMAWVLEESETNMVDSTDELWMLPDTPGYARTHLVYPVESMNGGGGHVVASMINGGSGGDVDSDESAAAMMQEEDEQMIMSVSTTSTTASPSLHDGLLQGSDGATSASTGGQQQHGDNAPATLGRWPKRRRRANSMVIGPEWIA